MTILVDVAESVLDDKVVNLSVGVVGTESGGQIVRGGVDEGKVVSEDCLVVLVGTGIGGVTLDGEVTCERWEVNLLEVVTRGNEEVLSIGGSCGQSVNTSLEGLVGSGGGTGLINYNCTSWGRSASIGNCTNWRDRTGSGASNDGSDQREDRKGTHDCEVLRV